MHRDHADIIIIGSGAGGGTTAHALAGSGARVLVTLLYALRDFGKKRGLATLCIGGGEAVAMVIERPV